MLMVPSAAMGPNIPVAFQGIGGTWWSCSTRSTPRPDASNWVAAGNTLNTFAGKGISAAAPAGGAWTCRPTGGRTAAAAGEVPGRRFTAGLAPARSRPRRARIVGAAQGGPGAPTWRRSTPTVPLRRLAVGLPGPATTASTALSPPGWPSSAASTRATCGACHSSAGGSGTPEVHVQLLADNNTRLWVFSPPAGVHRSRRDDRLLRHRPGHQPDVLSALPLDRRPQRALRLPRRRQP